MDADRCLRSDVIFPIHGVQDLKWLPAPVAAKLKAKEKEEERSIEQFKV